ncbi:hypothetical protein ECG_09444 [Echinococcus granulosus]|nr:hypothetical protein ECG_09444 [Echinococcus granulosus]
MKTALTFVTLSLVLFIAWCSAKPKLLSDKMHHMDVHMSSGRHEKVVYEADEQKDVEGKDVDITGGKRGQLPSDNVPTQYFISCATRLPLFRQQSLPHVMLVSDSLLSHFILSQLPGCDCRDDCVHSAFNAPTSVAAAASTTTSTIAFFFPCL